MNETLYYIAQILSILAFLVFATSFWCRKRSTILGMQVVGSSLYTLQFLILRGYSGVGVNAIGIIKSIVYVNKKNNNKYWLWVFAIAYGVIGIITWDGIISLFPIIASIEYVFLSYNDNPQYIRLGSIIASLFWIVYNFSILAYAGCFTETFLIISNVLAIVKHRKNQF